MQCRVNTRSQQEVARRRWVVDHLQPLLKLKVTKVNKEENEAT
jgi:hypothetical protein